MWAVFACAQIEEPKTEDGAEKVKMTFTATIAKEIETKTTLEGNLEDGVLKTMWMPSDAIGIGTATAGAENTKFEKFINTQTSNSETGVFEGSISLASNYYAIYPFSGSSFMWLPEGHIFMLNLPQTQKYVEGSFATEAAPMIASAAAGEVFEFQNLCGILALRLKGNEKVESITFSGKDANGDLIPVSGGFIIQTSNLLSLAAAPSEGALAAPTMTSVTLTCDEPVQLSTTESTPFYFVLPPATYNSFTVLVTTEDGKVMMKEGKTPLTIERAHAKPTAALEYAETEVIDLSVEGTANCYIVKPEQATYSLDLVKGNSKESVGTADNAVVLWETYNTTQTVTKNTVIESVNIKDNKLIVSIPENAHPGNALVAARSGETILWSWHIWVADWDVEATAQNYGNGIIMMDRNLGALNIADNDSRSYGLMYQWGRKDPFVAPVSENNFAQTTPANTLSSVDNIDDYNYSIKNPRVALRGSWDNNNNLWDNEKTIYDPCPAGWRVPDGSNNSPWASIREMGWNGNGTLVYFDTIDSDMAYYPTGGYADSNFAIMQFGTEASMYTCDALDTNSAYTFYYVNWGWAYSGSTSKEDFKSVRCQKIN